MNRSAEVETCTTDSLIDSLMAQQKKAAIQMAERIRELRERAGLSMEALARLVGVSKTAVQNWENGSTGLKGGNLAELAAALNVDMKEILGEKSVGQPTERRIVYESLVRFLSERAEGQSATAEERDWLASQRFPDNVDMGSATWWLSQLMMFRGLRIGTQPPPATQPTKPGRETKRS